MPPNVTGPDQSSERWTKNTGIATDDVRSEASRSSSIYRAIRPRPILTGAISTPSIEKTPQAADPNDPDQRSPGHQRRSPRGPTVASYLTGSSQTPESARAISLRHAGSDPTPLPLPITNLIRRRRSGSEVPNTYFPFRHSRRNDAQREALPEPCLLGLPMETRYRIYRLLLVKDHVLEFTTKRYAPRLIIPPLLQVNQQIREESSHVWYGLNHFSLTIKHGETSILRTFLAAIASLPSPAIEHLDIVLNTCFECNDLIAAAALLIAANMSARIKCVRGVYHFGHPKVEPCRLNTMQTINDQHFRPSVATALLRFSDPARTGAGFVIEGLWSGKFVRKALVHSWVYSYISHQSLDTGALGECNGQRGPPAFMINDYDVMISTLIRAWKGAMLFDQSPSDEVMSISLPDQTDSPNSWYRSRRITPVDALGAERSSRKASWSPNAQQ